MNIAPLARVPSLEDLSQHRRSVLRAYGRFVRTWPPTRRLARFLHTQLNRVQYDPLNPNDLTIENPLGNASDEQRRLNEQITLSKTLHDKLEAFFRQRPVSTSLLVFFVIATAAASARHNPMKIAVAVTIITLALPLLTSRQTDFDKGVPDQRP